MSEIPGQMKLFEDEPSDPLDFEEIEFHLDQFEEPITVRVPRNPYPDSYEQYRRISPTIHVCYCDKNRGAADALAATL